KITKPRHRHSSAGLLCPAHPPLQHTAVQGEIMLKRTFFIFVVVSCMLGLTLAAKKTSKGDDEKPGTLTLSIRDFCDPTTFNAILGPGTCVRDDSVSVDGSQTFTGFISE